MVRYGDDQDRCPLKIDGSVQKFVARNSILDDFLHFCSTNS